MRSIHLVLEFPKIVPGKICERKTTLSDSNEYELKAMGGGSEFG